MAKTNEAISCYDDPERFSPLMCRFESVLHRLRLAAHALHYLAEDVPIVEHGSAAFVLGEAAQDMERLYYDFRKAI